MDMDFVDIGAKLEKDCVGRGNCRLCRRVNYGLRRYELDCSYYYDYHEYYHIRFIDRYYHTETTK